MDNRWAGVANYFQLDDPSHIDWSEQQRGQEGLEGQATFWGVRGIFQLSPLRYENAGLGTVPASGTYTEG